MGRWLFVVPSLPYAVLAPRLGNRRGASTCRAVFGPDRPLPQEEKYTLTRGEILANITAILGGRVAEEIVFGEITAGAANDFEEATDLAHKMVTEFGMSDKLGPLTLGAKHGPVFLGRDLVESRNYSEEIAYEIDKEVRRIIDECHTRAQQVLTEHKAVLERISRAVLERESLENDELDLLIAGQPLPPDTTASTPVTTIEVTPARTPPTAQISSVFVGITGG
ncbi:MAG TPA: hypothetical protein VKW09_02185 [bacterium]|nr:hypothetical protein [bacterium]